MKKFRKRAVLLGALTLSVVTIGGVGSYAYFSDRSELVNDFTTGSLDLKVTESLWSNTTDGKNMYPGYTTSKNPTVQNVTGMIDNNAYVMATITAVDGAGRVITDKNRLDLIYTMIRYDASGNLQDGKKYSYDQINALPSVNPEWFLARRVLGDGQWVYYRSNTLDSASEKDSGQSSTLFNRISVPYEWTQSHLDLIGDFSLKVEFSGIQSATFNSLSDAMDVLDGAYEDGITNDYQENDEYRPSAGSR